MSDPIACVQKGGDPDKVVVWACGKCKLARSSELDAKECCAPNTCETCGKEIPRHSYCEDCAKKKSWEREKALYDKAKKVEFSEYGGAPVFCDHCDEYFDDVESLIDSHDDVDDPPTWAWGTYDIKLEFDAMDILERELESVDFEGGPLEHISKESVQELQALLTAWAAKQDLRSHMVDYGVVVDFEELLGEDD